MGITLTILYCILFYGFYVLIGVLITLASSFLSKTLFNNGGMNNFFIYLGWPILLVAIIIKFLKDVIEMLKDFDFKDNFKKGLKNLEFLKNLKQILKEILD